MAKKVLLMSEERRGGLRDNKGRRERRLQSAGELESSSGLHKKRSPATSRTYREKTCLRKEGDAHRIEKKRDDLTQYRGEKKMADQHPGRERNADSPKRERINERLVKGLFAHLRGERIAIGEIAGAGSRRKRKELFSTRGGPHVQTFTKEGVSRRRKRKEKKNVLETRPGEKNKGKKCSPRRERKGNRKRKKGTIFNIKKKDPGPARRSIKGAKSLLGRQKTRVRKKRGLRVARARKEDV